MKMVEEAPEALEHVKIITDRRESITITEFLDTINLMQVRTN